MTPKSIETDEDAASVASHSRVPASVIRIALNVLWLVSAMFWLVAGVHAQRARDLGIPFSGEPGALNAITDVFGVEVGHVTLIEGEGALDVGSGPVRTGVTVIHPRRKQSKDPVFAGWFALNGNGEMTGTAWVKESGFLEGPLAVTNTHSVGIVRDSLIAWMVENDRLFQPWALPVVAETYDGFLNDINGFHVHKEHVFEALTAAGSGPVAEGAIGGGTGMICYGFKGGIGTSSRQLTADAGGYVVGVVVQANFGSRTQLQVAGVPIGSVLDAPTPRRSDAEAGGSIIIVIGTDAPLLPHQLERLARRASMGIARTGGTSSNYSGDLFIAFSTANPGAASSDEATRVAMVPNSRINPIFDATVWAVEEAIINALVAGRTMVGHSGHRVVGLPHDALRELLRAARRLNE